MPAVRSAVATDGFDLSALRGSGRLSGRATLAQWQQRLVQAQAAIEALQAGARARARNATRWVIAAWAAFGIGVFTTSALVAGPLLCVAAGATWWRARRLAPPSSPTNLQALQSLLQALAPEIDPRREIDIDADLGGPISKAKRAGRDALPPRKRKGREVKIERTLFADPWLKMRVPLGAGAVVLLRQEDRAAMLVHRWRNPRGKYKSKTKYAVRHRVRARLVAPASRWTLAAAGEARRDGDRLRVSAERKAKSKGTAPSTMPPRLVLEAIAAVCAPLRPIAAGVGARRAR